jgi:GT2 family glycosyltransferase
MSDVDVIILDLDGGDLLLDCLDSLAVQTITPRQVIVFDNGSRVPVAQRLRDHPGLHVDVLRSETNLGFTGGVNEAFRQVTASFVALINNDVVLDRDWLTSVLDAMGDERVGAVQTIVRRDGATIDGAGISVGDGTIRQIGHGAALDVALPSAWGVSATAALYRTKALGLRVFDSRFFAYYEDAELSARLHEAGWATVVLPVAKAIHRGSQSASRLGSRAQRLRTRNRYFVARLHPGAGRMSAMVWEDLKLIPRGRASVRGMIEGMFGRVKSEG